MKAATTTAMLVERLHWPVPRVRWEAARQIASLILNGDSDARHAILDWLRRQQLEVDSVLPLSLIESFDIRGAFNFDELHEAIQAPSVLSDAVLARLYPGNEKRLFSFRWDFVQEDLGKDREIRLFEAGIGTIVPRIFESRLAQLQRNSGLPFLSHWRIEWTHLHRSQGEPYTNSPSFFFAGDRGSTGSFDVRQRAVFVSAFLRTLSFAHLVWRMPREIAVWASELALPFNEGLSRFLTSERPTWSTQLIERFETKKPVALAREIWSEATRDCEKEFEPIAVDVMDHDQQQAVRFEVYRVIEGVGGTQLPLKEIGEVPWLEVGSSRESLDGRLLPEQDWREVEGLCPLSAAVHPEVFGRAHIDLLAGHLQVVNPILAEGDAEVRCEPDRILLRDSLGLLSTLRLWYADWAPIHPPGLAPVGHVTTCRSTALKIFRKECELRTPRVARVTVSRRKYRYDAFEKTTNTFRL